MSTPSKEERRSFWQHCYARSSFVQALMFTELLLRQNPLTDDSLRRALTMAILVAYSRPFKQRKSVRLPDDIVPSEHRGTHDTMIELRDKVVAHRDLDGPVADWGFVSQLQLNMRGGELTIDTLSPTVTNDKVAELIPLINCLIGLMDRPAEEFVKRHLTCLVPSDGSSPPDGSYVVSIEDAPKQWLIKF